MQLQEANRCFLQSLLSLALHGTLLSSTPAAQVTSWFIVAVAAVGGALAMTGGLLGPPAGEGPGGGGGASGGNGGSTGLGIGCLGLVLAAQVGRSCSSAGNCIHLARSSSEHTAVATTSCSHVVSACGGQHQNRTMGSGTPAVFVSASSSSADDGQY